MMAELGHASSGPVLSSLTTFSDGTELKRGITFAGQFGGSLDARQLDHCVHAFCTAAIAGTEAINIGLRPLFPKSDEWCRKYNQLQKQLNAHEPIPDYLAERVEEYRKHFGPRPINDKAA